MKINLKRLLKNLLSTITLIQKQRKRNSNFEILIMPGL